MRSIACALLLSLLPSFVAAAASGPALEVFKSGVYKSAIPLLQRQCSTDKDNVTLRAALLSALVYEGKVDQAADLSQDLAQGFPSSPEALARPRRIPLLHRRNGRGGKALQSGDQSQGSDCSRYYGLYRIYKSASMYRSARMMCFRAHGLDPNDALITRAIPEYAHTRASQADAWFIHARASLG